MNARPSDEVQTPLTEPGTRDERLAAILIRLADAAAAGQPVNVEAVARAEPDLAAELRELWGAMFVATAAASASQHDSADYDTADYDRAGCRV